MGVRFVVLAYRKLTRREVLSTIRMTLANGRKRPKKGTIVTIHTVID